MYKEKTVSVVVPCYNEETQIERVVRTMPDYVDKIVIVDDKSTDKTVDKVRELEKEFGDKIVLLCHEVNQGVGGAIATGYIWARDNEIDCTAVMAGDAQMDPKDLPALLDPVVADEIDYSKGNRLYSGEAWEKIPKIRFFGNSMLSLMTKIASGYWHSVDSQTGYTVINLKALKTIKLEKIYKRYGMPNDLLIKLNVFNFRVRDIPIEPVYNVGEKSGIKVSKVIFTISSLLIKGFFWRLKEKYVIRDFHPLLFFYIFGMIFFFFGTLWGLHMTIFRVLGLLQMTVDSYKIEPTSALFVAFMAIMGLQMLFFGMWLDMDYNKELK